MLTPRNGPRGCSRVAGSFRLAPCVQTAVARDAPRLSNTSPVEPTVSGRLNPADKARRLRCALHAVVRALVNYPVFWIAFQ